MGNRPQLIRALFLGLSIVVVQVVGALWSNSLALLADAAHTLTDVAGIGLAIAAITVAARSTKPHRTYGLYRLEIIATIANGLLLLGLSGYILFEAVQRWAHPEPVKPGIMIAAAMYGVAANGVSLLMLRRGSGESLAVKGAYLEVMSDTLGSLGVVLAGLVVLATGFERADVVVSVLIALFMIPRTLLLLREAFGVLMENAPRELDLDGMRADMLAVPGVTALHDMHVWTITSGLVAMSCHVTVTDDPFTGGCGSQVLDDLQELLHDRYGITHTTLQLEPPDHASHEVGGHH
ncbi:MAG: cation diffusion facilitator family transporter [Candidatus Nanopelagicales bacterium]